MKKMMLLALALGMLIPIALAAQTYKIEGLWYDANKEIKVQFYQTKSGVYEGKIAWLREPNENGKPKVDKDNPDKSLRNRPLLNMVFIKNLKSRGKNKYDGATVYDVSSGNTYSAKIELTGPNTMKLRGYLGLSLLGRTETWTRAK